MPDITTNRDERFDSLYGQIREVITAARERFKPKHPSVPFNPDIAHTFFLSGLIEAWGRGIEKIVTACVQSGVPEPIIQQDSDGMWIQFIYPKLDEKLDRNREDGDEKRKSGDENGDEKGARLGEKLGENKAAILMLVLRLPKISVNELADQLDISRNTVDRNIQKLKKDGFLQRIGPAKGGHWKVIREKLDEA